MLFVYEWELSKFALNVAILWNFVDVKFTNQQSDFIHKPTIRFYCWHQKNQFLGPKLFGPLIVATHIWCKSWYEKNQSIWPPQLIVHTRKIFWWWNGGPILVLWYGAHNCLSVRKPVTCTLGYLNSDWQWYFVLKNAVTLEPVDRSWWNVACRI